VPTSAPDGSSDSRARNEEVIASERRQASGNDSASAPEVEGANDPAAEPGSTSSRPQIRAEMRSASLAPTRPLSKVTSSRS
jgi:hypothetical protein